MVRQAVFLIAGGLLLAAPAAAQRQHCGPLDRAEFRQPELSFVPRTLTSMVAVPAGVVTWQPEDWAEFGLWSSLTVGLMVPAPDVSLDVQFQEWVEQNQNPFLDAFFIHLGTIPMTIGVLGLNATLWLSGLIADAPEVVEFASLMLETLALVQVHHVTMKVLLGREGPHQVNGQGHIHGPTLQYFPGGTPSGHAATMYGIMSVTAEYWDSDILRVLAHVVGIYTSISLVYNGAHFLSDVVWGAAMGYHLGRWVAQHRSSRASCREWRKHRLGQDPVILPIASHQGLVLTVSAPLD